MRTITIISTLTLVSLFTSSCYKRRGWTAIQGRGDVVTEKRYLKNADRIQLSIDANVEYKQDSAYFLEVTAQPNILSVVRTDVHGTTLKISYSQEVWQHKQVTVVVHTPNMKGMNISGSGNISSDFEIKTSLLDLGIGGSGNISLGKVEAATLSAKISGSGNITLRDGSCDNQVMSISGSGNIRSAGCVTDSNNSTISGSGNIDINVIESLDVKISGSGDIRYRGIPAVSVDISGSGKLIHVK